MRRALTSWGWNLKLPAVFVFVLLAQAGCSRFAIKVPSGFVTLKKGETRQVLVSSDNTLIVVRAWKNHPKGGLPFWQATLRRDFEKVRAYKFVDTKPAVSARGNKGVTMHFQGAYRGGMYDYFITLFVLPEWIYTVEMLAQHKQTDQYLSGYSKVVKSLEPK